ncbi:AAA family ATPase [Desulfobacterales bacterium HSG2]|nr:AAA family ATPase [Desulfobacterales bacterium HSG2]
MKRFIDRELRRWKQSRRRKPLIIRGARQVGKTYSVRRFGEEAFDSVVIVDLERNPDWHRVFSGNLDARRICSDLEILLGQRIIPGRTLLFIDEIQAFSRAITALRYFYEELPALHVVAAGSLLEFAMGRNHSRSGGCSFSPFIRSALPNTFWQRAMTEQRR